MVLNPNSMGTSMHALKMTEVGNDLVPTPVNSQKKLDEITLTLVDAKTGEFKINAPYNIAVSLECRKTMAVIVGEETNNNKEEK